MAIKLTGNFSEDTQILINEMEYISKLINENDIDNALNCIEIIIKDIEELKLNTNENKEKYHYEVWKSMYKKFSRKK